MDRRLERQRLGKNSREATVFPPDNSNDGLDLEQLLVAMEVAQNLQVGGTDAGETSAVLTSTIEILENLAPPFRMAVLLFTAIETGDSNGVVFSLDSVIVRPDWLNQRPVGHLAFIPDWAELPANITSGPRALNAEMVTVAAPLYAPSVADVEAGLLFVMAPAGWPRDGLLRLGAKLSGFVTQRWQVHHELNQKIHLDALTGLYNRRFLDGQLPLLVERARRNRTSLALIVADIDLFKNVNSEYGLIAGDLVLQMVARRLKEEVRQVDEVFRRGGEEFAVILPETGPEAAHEVLTRLLRAPLVAEILHRGHRVRVRVTLSCGVALFSRDALDDKQLHDRAQEMMLKAKKSGRQRGYFWGEDGAILGDVSGASD